MSTAKEKRATKQANAFFLKALEEAHINNQHNDLETGTVDPTGYWRELGCPACITAYKPSQSQSQSEDFELITRRSDIIGDLYLDVFTLRETTPLEPQAVWTVLIYQTHPEHDTVINPQGRITPTAQVPAGIWGLLYTVYDQDQEQQ